MIVAEWSSLTLLTKAFTRICDLENIEDNSDDDNGKDEEQWPDIFTVSKALNTIKVIFKYILCF